MTSDQSEISEFLESVPIVELPKHRIDERLSLARVFQLYLEWCGVRGQVPTCLGSNALARKVYQIRPDWRERHTRPNKKEGRLSVFIGLKEEGGA